MSTLAPQGLALANVDDIRSHAQRLEKQRVRALSQVRRAQAKERIQHRERSRHVDRVHLPGQAVYVTYHGAQSRCDKRVLIAVCLKDMSEYVCVF